MFKLIIQMKFHILFCNNTPLTSAICKNDTKIVKLLLSTPNIDVNSKSILVF